MEEGKGVDTGKDKTEREDGGNVVEGKKSKRGICWRRKRRVQGNEVRNGSSWENAQGLLTRLE